MLSSIALATLRTASRATPIMMMTRAPVAQAAAARYATHHRRVMSMSTTPFAVDAPDGDHDLQDLEESSEWAQRTVNVASVTEDTATINQIHDAVSFACLGRVYAVQYFRLAEITISNQYT